jgi:hypothetical protein
MQEAVLRFVFKYIREKASTKETDRGTENMIFDRLEQTFSLARFLYIQRVSGLTPPGDDPYMPPEEIARFKKEIAKVDCYLEFGSGGSTVYASKLGVEAVSVENDRFYAEVVATRLHGCSVRQIIIGMGLTREWGIPVFARPRKAQAYISAPWQYMPRPKFILIDGRYRAACALESARQANLHGHSAVLMFDDYKERPSYHNVEQFLGVPEMVGRAAIFEIGSQSVKESDIQGWLHDPL